MDSRLVHRLIQFRAELRSRRRHFEGASRSSGVKLRHRQSELGRQPSRVLSIVCADLTLRFVKSGPVNQVDVGVLYF